MNVSQNDCVACGGQLKFWFKRGKYTYLLCQQCRSCVTSPIPPEKVIINYYRHKFRQGNYLLLRKYAEQYLVVYQQFVDVIVRRYREARENLKGKKVLDVGCFTGEFLELMQQKGAIVYGTELQKEALKIAQTKFPNKIFQADIATKRFPKYKFEIVTLLGLIEHVTDPKELLGSSYKLMKKGALLVIQTPDNGSWLARCLGRWWPPLAPIEHIHVFSELGIKLMLSSHGFTDIKVKKHVKRLPVAYVYSQFSTFGHHFGRLLAPIGWLLSRLPANIILPFYGGEMIVTARKS